MKTTLKAQYDKYIYPIVAPPAIAVVKFIARCLRRLVDNMGENRYE